MIHYTTDLERQQAAEIERLLGGMKRYEEMAAMASAEIADLTAEIERLRAALNEIASWREGPVVTGAFDEPHSAMTARAALGAQPAQPAQRLPLVQATAPREIWLQVSDDAEDKAEPFPENHDGITWCQDSVLSCEVRYVRADLAAAKDTP